MVSIDGSRRKKSACVCEKEGGGDTKDALVTMQFRGIHFFFILFMHQGVQCDDMASVGNVRNLYTCRYYNCIFRHPWENRVAFDVLRFVFALFKCDGRKSLGHIIRLMVFFFRSSLFFLHLPFSPSFKYYATLFPRSFVAVIVWLSFRVK